MVKLFRKLIYFMIFGMVFLAIAAIPDNPPANAGQQDSAAVNPEIPATGHVIVVTYFHNTIRCPTCHRIENLSDQAIHSHFSKGLLSGKLIWRVVNVDEPQNEHYNTDYQLYTKSLIVSEVKDGKEVRWKNLEKIWTLVGDENQFDNYVQTEIADWLKAP